jgi:hypothetical protein
VNECGRDMEDDECPDPREEQNERETKKHKSHEQCPVCHSITGVGFSSVPARQSLVALRRRLPPQSTEHARPVPRNLISVNCFTLHRESNPQSPPFFARAVQAEGRGTFQDCHRCPPAAAIRRSNILIAIINSKRKECPARNGPPFLVDRRNSCTDIYFHFGRGRI